MNSEPYKSVSEFYAGKSVFITGATGFLGKVIVEKILYTCIDVERVYVLVRGKKGVNAKERLTQTLNKPLFSRLKAERPEALEKIVPVIGDIAVRDLGVSKESLKVLKEKVTIVIHGAATIKFNEPLEVAMNVNVDGTRNVLNLCHQMKNVEAFVYISTIYTSPGRDVIEEILYPAPVTLEEAYQFAKQYGCDEKKTKQFLGDRPNTYTFTKSLAENLVADERESLPTVIIKPSMVTAAKNEPLVGWIDNMYGPTGILISIAKGLTRCVLGRPGLVLDFIPVDYVSNLTVIAAAKGARPNELQVYNSCSGSFNRNAMNKISDIFVAESRKYNFHMFPFPGVLLITPHKYKVRIINAFLMMVAYMTDLCNQCLGKESRYMKFVAQSIHSQTAVEYFTTKCWDIKCDKARALYNSLPTTDKVLFPCDPINIDWKRYTKDYFTGVYQYMMK